MDALKIEGRSLKRLLKLAESLKSVYEDGGKPTVEEVQVLRRAVRRWIKTTKTVAGVTGEQTSKD